MYVYGPVEYYMLQKYILNMRKVNREEVTADHIELIAIHTGNKAFRTVMFRKALIAYREYGMYPPKKAHWTVRDALYYARYSGLVHKELKECEMELS